MKVEIISIGDELLIGKTINTNASWIGEQLSMLGFTINRVTTISDKRDAIISNIEHALQENSLVIVTGGLGPTNDDITKHVLCEIFNTELEMHAEAYANLEQFVLNRKGVMNELNKSQALHPKAAKFIPNSCGTASGMWFTKNNAHCIAMPGVPFEMIAMMQNFIIPQLSKHFTLPCIIHRHILVCNIAESLLAEKIADWEKQLPSEIALAYLPSPGIVKLRLTCTAANETIAQQIIAKHEQLLFPIIADNIYGYNEDTFETILAKLLLKTNSTLSVAESCSGGTLAQSIVSVAGSSAYFKGGVVAYANEIKEQILSVPKATLEEFGAVSKEVVELMAISCKKVFNTTYALATSGIAGPDGGSEEKPVGTVWIAVSGPEGTIAKQYNFGNNRERTMLRTSLTAMRMLQMYIQSNE